MDTQKIDFSNLDTYKRDIALFQVDDKDEKSRFFEEIFLLANISIDVTFRILFLIFRNIKKNFNDKKLR